MGNIKGFWRFLIPICFLLLLSSNSERLSNTRFRLKSKRKLLETTQRKEKGLKQELNDIDRKINLIEDIVSQLDSMKAIFSDSLIFLKQRRNKINKKLLKEKELLAHLAIEAYKRGKIGELEFVLDGSSNTDALRRAHFVTVMGNYRGRKIREYSAQRDTFEQVQSAIDSTVRVIEQTRSEKKSRLISLRSLKKHRKSEIAQLRRKRKKYEREIKKLEESIAELENAIARGKNVTVRGRSFSKLKGRLPWPIKGKRKIIRGFGFRREKGRRIVIKNSGIDIAASPKSSVYIVCDGEVVYTSWLQGYDNVVLVKHAGGYYTVYGNLGEVAVSAGSKVKAGQLVGKTSSTGWLDGPKLHFEVRKGKHEENPMDWLVRR